MPSKPRKPRAARALAPPAAAKATAALVEPLADGGLLARGPMGPLLYGVLRADLHLAPLKDSDAEGLGQAVALLGEALASQLAFTLNWNENSTRPRIVRFAPKHLEHVPGSLGVLTGSKYEQEKLFYMMAKGEYHQVVDVSFKGAGDAPDPSKARRRGA